MAVLLPSPHLKHVKMSPGERHFAARLLSKLEDDYHCWFDVPIGNRQVRPDFVVLHPGRGVLILEVKDWKPDTIRGIDAKTAEILIDTGIKHVPNPLEQARSYALEVKELLEVDPLLVEHENPKYKGRLIFPWGFGVVFPNISRAQFDSMGIEPAIPPDKVICSDEMRERIDAEQFQQKLWGMFTYNFGTVLSMARIERIRWHLFPEIRIHQDGLFTEAPADGPSEAISKAIPDIIKVMDHEQEKFARNMGEGHRMIHGVAGSGKTLILAYRCLHLSNAGYQKPVLVLCFNKSLAAKLTKLLRERGVGNNVHVRHFHGWCIDMCQLYQLDLPADEDKPVWDRQVAAVIAGAESGRVPRAQYAGILIDEGHDFEPEWFKLIVQMLDPETDSLLLVYDDVQGIYKRNRPKTWASVGIRVPGRRSTILKVNYRNTAEALDVAFHFVSEYLDESNSTEDIPLVRPDTGKRHGSLPTITRCASFKEEIDKIAAWFKVKHNEGTPFHRMAVLGRYRNQLDNAIQGLRRNGVPASQFDITSRPTENAVQVMTIHSSKGLEFACVAIPDLGCMPSPKVDVAEEGRLLYVGMTRAVQELMLTYHSTSTFTKKIEAELQSGAEKYAERIKQPTIVQCERCDQKLRVPTGKALAIKCTKCDYQFVLST